VYKFSVLGETVALYITDVSDGFSDIIEDGDQYYDDLVEVSSFADEIVNSDGFDEYSYNFIYEEFLNEYTFADLENTLSDLIDSPELYKDYSDYISTSFDLKPGEIVFGSEVSFEDGYLFLSNEDLKFFDYNDLDFKSNVLDLTNLNKHDYDDFD
jgi:hypothetical protein